MPSGLLGRVRRFLPVVGCLMACTEFEAGTDELAVGVQNAEAAPGEDWSCLTSAQPAAPYEPEVPTGRVVYTIRLLDLATQTPVPDMRVRACALTNLNCDAPVTADLIADAEGWVDVPLPEDFRGYLELESPTTIPTLYIIPPELPPPGEAEFPGLIPATADYAQLTTVTLGRALADDEAAIALRVFDCSWNTAVGVSVSSDLAGVPFYFQGGLPNPRATATDVAGLAGIMAIPEGLVTVRAQQANGLDIAEPRGVIVRAGWMSASFFKPRRQTAMASD